MNPSPHNRIADQAAALGLPLDSSDLERMARGAAFLAATARASGISQYDDSDSALSHAMAPALAYFALDESPRSGRLADLGAGNGALGCTLALLEPKLHVSLIDRAQRSYTVCELLIARMGLKNADCMMLSVDRGTQALYDAVVFRALARAQQALELASSILRPGGFIGAWHSGSDSSYLDPPESLRVIATVDTVVPELVLTGYRI